MKINEVLSLVKVVRERLGDLKAMRTQVAVKETYYREPEKVIEPQYDIKELDAKIVKLQNFLFEADSRVKAANAVTDVPGFENTQVSDILGSL